MSRPRLGVETVSVTLKMSRKLLDGVEAAAEVKHMTRSEYIRWSLALGVLGSGEVSETQGRRLMLEWDVPTPPVPRDVADELTREAEDLGLYNDPPIPVGISDPPVSREEFPSDVVGADPPISDPPIPGEPPHSSEGASARARDAIASLLSVPDGSSQEPVSVPDGNFEEECVEHTPRTVGLVTICEECGAILHVDRG